MYHYVRYESASFPHFAWVLYHRLGDTVMEEAVVRLVAREAMAALEREREEDTAAAGGSGEEEVPPGLTGSTLSWRLDSAIRLVVSNANLGAVSIRVWKGRDGAGWKRIDGGGFLHFCPESNRRVVYVIHYFFASDTSVALDLDGCRSVVWEVSHAY